MKMKKYIASAMALLMVLCMIPTVSHAMSFTILVSGTYTMSAEGYTTGDRLTILPGKTVTLIGSSSVIYTNFSITCGAGVTLTMNNVNIDDSGNDGVCPLAFTGAGNTLVLAQGSQNTLKGGRNCAGVSVGGGAELTVEGTGTLNAFGKGGDVSDTSSGAGIGGAGDLNTINDSGSITIAGGIVNATGGYYAAGIGGGYSGVGTVTITGGTVTATGGTKGAGIGGGTYDNGTVRITDGIVTANGGTLGAGIGGGASGAGAVTIEGGTIIAVGTGGAGVGGGDTGDGAVTVSGGTITASGYGGGAGIGGGYHSDGTVTVTGGAVTATGGAAGSGVGGAAGIGGGYYGSGTVNISGGTINATGVDKAAGIGRGTTGAAGTVEITGGTVFADGTSGAYQDIDSGTAGSDGSLKISGLAQVFMRHGLITPPTTSTHTRSDYGAGTASVYGIGMPSDWTDAFGAYLRVCTLSYDANGGMGVPPAEPQLYGKAASVAPGNNIARGNWVFTGWNTKADGSGTAYQAGDEYPLTADGTLYAQWDGTDVAAAPNNAACGSVTGAGEYEPGSSVTVTATPNAGYCFTGWYAGDALLSSDASYTFTAGNDVSLTARFSGLFTITAVSGNSAYGSVTGGGSFTAGASVQLSATPSAGYYFTGWYSGDTLVSSSAAYTFTASQSLTLTARFAARVKITAISGNAAHGSVNGGGEYVPGASVTLTAAANSGCYFTGWFAGKTLVSSSAVYTFTATQDAAYTAKFGSVGIPESIRASATHNKITVSWSAAPGATGYNVYRAASKNGAYSLVKTVTSTGYSQTGLAPGTTLYFKVRPFARSGRNYVYGGDSAAVSATTRLGQVTRLKVTAVGPASVSLTWNAVAGAGRYQVWRTDLKDGGEEDYTLVADTSACKLTNTSLTADHTYYYKVIACNRQRTVFGGFSAAVAAKPVMGRVIGVKASGSPKNAKLSWTKLKGVVKYEIWVSDTKDGAFKLVGETKSNQFSVSAPSVRYYKVRAYCFVIKTKHYGAYSAVVRP